MPHCESHSGLFRHPRDTDVVSTVATYTYDAINWRVKKVTNGETHVFYYNRRWQCLEEYINGIADIQYVWGLRYVDDLVRYVKGAETLYVIQDANFNVVALTNTSDSVTERYTYNAFGKRNVYDANFIPKSTSQFPHFTRTFTGQVLDMETGMLLYCNRHYHPTLGRFIQRDPIGYRANDVNLFRYVKNQIFIRQDAMGLEENLLLKIQGDITARPPSGAWTPPNFTWQGTWTEEEKILILEASYELAFIVLKRRENILRGINYIKESPDFSCECKISLFLCLQTYYKALDGIYKFLNGTDTLKLNQVWIFFGEVDGRYNGEPKKGDTVSINAYGDFDWRQKLQLDLMKTLFHEIGHHYGFGDPKDPLTGNVYDQELIDGCPYMNAHTNTVQLWDNSTEIEKSSFFREFKNSLAECKEGS